MSEADKIKVNRAPVLTLWAAIVAERLGHDADAAITLGRAVAGSSARIKARAIGIEEPEKGDDKPKPIPTAKPETVHLLGRDVPVVKAKGSLRALAEGKAAAVTPARGYVERAFGEHLVAVRKAMEDLARSVDPDELNRVGFRLYERFRPEVEPGAKGWGVKGVLDLEKIRGAAG
ncbi:hypothetical protein D9599_25840 [Roseomonas sp. KE2513]|uniref:hypothetical protein n=1 Tax=Roseomonas sp. KE2513 TaxID=2479202 RepID=UPI0018E06288|nr:hypothetical protein [Roseomonas sp. KE2513]MBI0538978.1 hypothetical protein [Roseomonas sp. KE2513]